MKKSYSITRDVAANIVGVSLSRIQHMTFEDNVKKLTAKKVDGQYRWSIEECKALRKQRDANATTKALAQEWDKLHRKHDGRITLAELKHPRSGNHLHGEAAKAKAKTAKAKAKGKTVKGKAKRK